MSRNLKPRMFIGSSAEGLAEAKAIQKNLDYAAECELWSQGFFKPGVGTLEGLAENSGEFDFAALVLTPDDLQQKRGESKNAPRDNVLLELGLFVGKLGRRRTFIVYDRGADLSLPSDLAGVTPITFSRHASGNLEASLGAACSTIEQVIKELGLRPAETELDVNQETHFRVICDLLGSVERQVIILMHDTGCTLRRTPFGGSFTFRAQQHSSEEILGWASSGQLSVDTLCTRLPDAGILTINLRNMVGLSERGHKFAEWLIEHGEKAACFESEAGSWGPPPTIRFPPVTTQSTLPPPAAAPDNEDPPCE